MHLKREAIEYDVVIVGGGPAGLATAIRFKQLCLQHNKNLSVCILEKGAEIGAHILSGAVFEPRALTELLPDWQQLKAPLHTKAKTDQFLFLTKRHALRFPTPPQMHNHGNYIISLNHLCRFLAKQAENLGVDIFPSFAAVDVIYDEHGAVAGIATDDKGLKSDGTPGNNFQQGIIIKSKQLILAEGCRGSLSQRVIQKFNLAKESDPQTYGIGIKEIWQVDPKKHQPGLIMHTIGWPLDRKTYGGSFIYHWEKQHVLIGFVVGLDYQNPYLNPFMELQRFKLHPKIRPLFEGAKRIEYGARALNEGGWQSIPKLTFPGGLLVGCAAGFLNVPKIKGSHTAMKSGMLAAECVFNMLQNNEAAQHECVAYPEALKKSWVYEELYRARNIRPGFQHGLWSGLVNAALDTYLLRGRAPWTLHTKHADYQRTLPAKQCKRIEYPKPDNIITFDRLSSVYLANTHHNEQQPCHLHLRDQTLPVKTNLAQYAGLEQYYCPAAVYEYLQHDGKPYLQINAANCVHCKTCDIKDPKQNIEWVPPEGGSGPNYHEM